MAVKRYLELLRELADLVVIFFLNSVTRWAFWRWAFFSLWHRFFGEAADHWTSVRSHQLRNKCLVSISADHWRANNRCLCSRDDCK